MWSMIYMKRTLIITSLLVAGVAVNARAQAPIDWKAVEAETLQQRSGRYCSQNTRH
jgi:hypothetical protein